MWNKYVKPKQDNLNSILNTVLGLNIDKFFPFEEELEDSLPPELKKASGNYQNLFWVIGGSNIVRSSRILRLIYDKLKTVLDIIFKDDMVSKEVINLRTIVDNYDGPRYTLEDYWILDGSGVYSPVERSTREENAPSLDDIYKHLKVHMTLQFRLTELLDEGYTDYKVYGMD